MSRQGEEIGIDRPNKSVCNIDIIAEQEKLCYFHVYTIKV